jgi:hypothetical protein
MTTYEKLQLALLSIAFLTVLGVFVIARNTETKL